MEQKHTQENRLRSSEAAHYLKYVDNTLRASRVTGTLGGRLAPPYQKIGGKIFYEKSDLDLWLASFKKQHNTAENV